MLVALRLGQAGIKTLVLEKHDELLFSTRGCAYQPVVLNALRELGLLDLIKEHAYLNRDGVHWRDMSGKELAVLPIQEGEYILLMGQKRLNDLILKELEKYPMVTILFNHSYVGCEQTAEQVKVMIHENSAKADEDKFVTASWLVGADGARSTVRQSLCIPFEGISFTDFRVIGADVYYDFSADGYAMMNYIRDPVDWCGMLYTGENKDGKPYGESAPLWRVAYVESTDLSLKKEDIHERAQQRLSRYTKQPTKFDIFRAEPYRVQQKCAAQAIKGRVILVGDALHSNNPAGGFGLTTGIMDAYTMGDVLVQVCHGQSPKSRLNEAAEDRRQTWLNVTNKMSMAMFKRLAGHGPEDTQECEEYFQGLNNDAEYPKKARAFLEKIAGKSFVVQEQGTESPPLHQEVATLLSVSG